MTELKIYLVNLLLTIFTGGHPSNMKNLNLSIPALAAVMSATALHPCGAICVINWMKRERLSLKNKPRRA